MCVAVAYRFSLHHQSHLTSHTSTGELRGSSGTSRRWHAVGAPGDAPEGPDASKCTLCVVCSAEVIGRMAKSSEKGSGGGRFKCKGNAGSVLGGGSAIAGKSKPCCLPSGSQDRVPGQSVWTKKAPRTWWGYVSFAWECGSPHLTSTAEPLLYTCSNCI